MKKQTEPSKRVDGSRRRFLAATAACAMGPLIVRGDERPVLGQGDFRYRVVPGWGVLGEATPVNNCHGIVQDREGHLMLFTDHMKNNVIVYDKAGRLVHKWGTAYPGAHGLSLVEESNQQVMYLTDLSRHAVFKTTRDGTLLQEWQWPQSTGKYEKADQYRPSWTLHLPSGEFFVLDGYGRDYVMRYGADGALQSIFGGAEGGITHWGPHGGMVDARDVKNPTLLIAMSDQQYLLRLDLQGKKLQQVDLPGGNPRQIRPWGKHFIVAHLSENWPKDKNARGYVSILDADLKVISNVGGAAPQYADDGTLGRMGEAGGTFKHPHDACMDEDGSIYVAQFASGGTYPIKLERV